MSLKYFFQCFCGCVSKQCSRLSVPSAHFLLASIFYNLIFFLTPIFYFFFGCATHMTSIANPFASHIL